MIGYHMGIFLMDRATKQNVGLMADIENFMETMLSNHILIAIARQHNLHCRCVSYSKMDIKF